MPLLWTANLDRLRDSLIAQADRIRLAGHPSIKGSSLEFVLRRTLTEYLPDYFAIGAGQIANNKGDLSPQLDVMVYDNTVFPNLSVNEDSSVVICCEALYAAVECKASWDRQRVEGHCRKFLEAESKRHESYADPVSAAAYFAVVFDNMRLDGGALDGLKYEEMTVGVYSISGNCAAYSHCGEVDFQLRNGNALALLMKDLLLDVMEKGSKDEGSFLNAYSALQTYFD